MELIYRGYWLSVEPDRIGARFRRHAESKTETAGEIGFAPEFEAISAEFRSRFGTCGRLSLKWQSMLSRRQAKAEEKLYSGNPASLVRTLSAALQYPPILLNRFFWGAVRRLLLR